MKLLNKFILGINDTHDASAAIVYNGQIICAISEERIQRIKSAGGFPKGAINACLKFSGIKMKDIDYVAVAGNRAVPINMLGLNSTLELKDHIKIQEKIRKPQFYGGKVSSYSAIFPNYKSKGKTYYSIKDIPLKETRELTPKEKRQVKEYRLRFIAEQTGKDLSKIFTFDHHLCHIYYGYYASPFRKKKVAAISLDAGGDGVYESISIFDKKSKHKRIYAGHDCLIGPIYTMITLLLKMKPNEHEFKVMGLAPYAKEFEKKKTREFLETILKLKGIKFKKNPNLKDFYFHIADEIKYERFDGIAGGLQDWLEKILSNWIINVVKYTKANNIIFCGGVALNVKANQVLAKLKNVKKIFVPPGSGDESLSIGACWALMDKLEKSGNHRKNILPLKNAYLGDSFTKKEINEFINHPIVKKKYKKISGDVDKLAANALVKNETVAICRGRMEFGPRSLGHRSLIANPSSKEMVEKINSSIKGRDFWMPFAPSIMDEKINNCIKNNKKCDLSYMTFTSETLIKMKKNFIATLHPADHSMRVQSVNSSTSPSFYRLLKLFYKKSGVPGVLNTSLNIHGKPIVKSPVDIANELLNVSKISINNIIIDKYFFKLK
tara:strand:+ start:32 stop:1855 length:1824 start_codon:yes stop_codon:yes gene_type:complete